MCVQSIVISEFSIVMSVVLVVLDNQNNNAGLQNCDCAHVRSVSLQSHIATYWPEMKNISLYRHLCGAKGLL